MTEQEKLKLAQIIARRLCPNRNSHFNLYGDKANCYTHENFAECQAVTNTVDDLIAAGFIFDSERKRRAAFFSNAYRSCSNDLDAMTHLAEVADIVISELRAKLSKAEHDRDRYARRITLLQAQKGSQEGKDG